MIHQGTLSELEMTSTRLSRLTQRQRYFKRLNELYPFDAIEKLIRPHYFLSGQRGRQPYPLGTMIRVYIFQILYNLCDLATEDLLSENWVARGFVGLDWGTPTPDETTFIDSPRSIISIISNGMPFESHTSNFQKMANGICGSLRSVKD